MGIILGHDSQKENALRVDDRHFESGNDVAAFCTQQDIAQGWRLFGVYECLCQLGRKPVSTTRTDISNPSPQQCSFGPAPKPAPKRVQLFECSLFQFDEILFWLRLIVPNKGSRVLVDLAIRFPIFTVQYFSFTRPPTRDWMSWLEYHDVCWIEGCKPYTLVEVVCPQKPAKVWGVGR